MVSSIADSIVVKNENIFFLTEPDGDVPLNGAHGLGLYYHDCRFLKGYELKLAGITPIPLVSTAVNGYQAIFQITNPDIKMADGKLIPKDSLGIKCERLVDGANSTLHDAIELQNFGLQAIEFPISLAFEAGFQDVFAVRQMLDETPGKLQAPHWSDGLLTFIYEGADRLYRCLAIHCLPSPQSTDGTTANFRLTLQPRESKRISVSLSIAESEDPKKINPEPSYRPDLKKVRSDLQASSDECVAGHTQFDSNSILLNSIMDRSLRDLRVLRSSIQGNTFFIAAGFRRYGFDNETLRIFSGIIEAAMHFEHYRLPELFAGFRREDYKVPVRYPVACHPQAWAAVTVPYLIETLLGFAPEAFENRLRIIRPMLPDFLNYIEVRGLRVGKATADLRFERTAKGTDVQILKVNGQLDVTVES